MSAKAIETGIRAAVGLGTVAYNFYRGGSNMATKSTPVPARRVAQRRMKPVRRVTYRQPYRSLASSFRRTTATFTVAATAGRLNGSRDLKLADVYTPDILAAFDVYRIRKILVEIVPRVDPGQSVANNTSIHLITACDQTGQISTVAAQQDLCQFSNYKSQAIVSGGRYYYAFYPKALNTVDNAGVATAVGNYSGANPWLNLSNTGIQIPHYRFLYDIVSTNATYNLNVDFTYTIFFDCNVTK